MNNFREFEIWRKSRSLLLSIYQVTDMFPQNELNRLANQIRNHCVDILVTIKRGFAKEKPVELKKSIVSLNKLENQFQKACNLCIMEKSDYQYLVKQTDEIIYMLSYFIKETKNYC